MFHIGTQTGCLRICRRSQMLAVTSEALPSMSQGNVAYLFVEEAPQRSRSLDSDKILQWEPNPEEKELIKQTWSDDFTFLYELGANIYTYIFEHNPDCKKLFPVIFSYGDKYRECKEFRSQALKFVQAIAHTVKNIYHMPDLVPYLVDIGKRHVKFADRGFKPEFWDVFLDAMEYSLTGQINSIENIGAEDKTRAVQVWRRLAYYIITHLKHGFFDELKRQGRKLD